MVDEQDRLRRLRAAEAKAKADAEAAQAKSREDRMAELKAEREKRMAEEAAARAAADPMRDPTNRPEAPQTEPGFIQYYGWIGGASSGRWKLYKTPVDSPTAASAEARSEGGRTQATFGSAVGANTVIGPSTTTGGGTGGAGTGGAGTGGAGTGGAGTGGGTGGAGTGTGAGGAGTGGAGTGAGTGAGAGAGTGAPAGPSLARDTFKNTLALFFGATEAAKPWADALYGVVSKYFRSGSDANESFNLALQEARTNPALKPFADRFKGIFALQDMRQQGKPVLVPTIGEYVAAQAGMSNLLTEAGLGNLATEDFTSDLIGKGNSVSAVADKIRQAFTRIDLAPKAIKDTLSRFYPTVDRTTLARTILTGEKGVQQLVDELAEYEVLAAAEQQGLGAIQRAGGLTQERAREIARAGGTFESTLGKFGQIARVMPDVTKLAGISRREDIGQAGLERAVISQSQKELSELEKLSLEEEARFRARTGMADIPLASQRRANRAF